jgi:plastocyanin
MTRGRLMIVVLALAGAALWPAASASAGNICHTGATEGSGDTVAMSKMCFTPSILHVEPGTDVTFVNEDPTPHNISSDWGRGAELKKGDLFSANFPDEGTFPYACTYHYGMTGAIVVGDGDGTASAAPVVGGYISGTPVSEERAASPEPQGSALLGWTFAGAIGLLFGAGGTGLIRRRREAKAESV